VKPEHPQAVGRIIRYSTLGAGTGYRETAVWPPQGLAAQTLYLGQGGRLTPTAPAAGSVTYKVDFSTTSGSQNRWIGVATADDVVYPDRRNEDKKTLAFTSDRYAEDSEITGMPVVRLALSTHASDTAVFAYLEDVAPDGRVTLITEGILRARNRRISAAPFVTTAPYHSLRRADALPVHPGEVMEMDIALGSTSVLIRKGHRLRVAFVGADASVFERVPATGPAPQWQVQLGASTLTVTTGRWH
jgi:putative CocE/NonD family hydrolase